MSTYDIKKGVFLFGGSKDSKVSVVEIDKLKSVIVSKITNISSINSISYNDIGMTLWQYFNCGKGKTVLFSGLEFVTGLAEIEPFEGGEIFRANRNQKKRKDRCLNAGVYCNDYIMLICLFVWPTPNLSEELMLKQ